MVLKDGPAVLTSWRFVANWRKFGSESGSIELAELELVEQSDPLSVSESDEI
jgi:hypothetical protein